jgi:tripartite-type tricarboxylate transporter receptor subunit TctC
MANWRRSARPVAALILAGLLLSCAPASGTPRAAREAPAAAPTAPSAPANTSATTAGPTASDAGSATDFYRGKTLRLVVGFAPGGGYDIWARLLAKHLGRHIPGNPAVIVENKPGAGSMLAANLVYNSEPKDGTVVVTFNSQMVLQQLLSQPGLEFDARRFQWLGSASSGQNACMVRRELGITDARQIIGPGGREVVMGGEAPGSGITDTPAVMNAALGTRFKIIYGYEGASKVQLAVESGELDGFCLTWDSVLATLKPWFEPTPLVTVPLIMGDRVPAHPWLKGTAAAEALAPDDQARKLLRAVQGPRAITIPYAVAPGVPAERVAVLRQAVDRAFADPALLAEAERGALAVEYKSADAVTQIVTELLSLDPDTIGAVKRALAAPG